MKIADAYAACVQAALDGVAAGDALYWKMSDGCWLGSAPEYFATVKIAEALSRTGLGPVTMEESRRTVMTGCGLADKRVHSTKVLRAGGRCDIVLWHGQGEDEERPRAVVEVKTNPHTRELILPDCRFIGKLLQRADGFEFGLFVAHLEMETSGKGQARDLLIQRIRTLADHAQREFQGTSLSVDVNARCHYHDNGDAAGALVVGFARSGTIRVLGTKEVACVHDESYAAVATSRPTRAIEPA